MIDFQFIYTVTLILLLANKLIMTLGSFGVLGLLIGIYFMTSIYT